MVLVSTYVFVDIETTGLPREELNKTKITEISMVAVNREHILNNNGDSLPRVQNKLTLCINPRKMVSQESSMITKLCNELLENQPPFNMEVYNIINNFLNVLAKPVCLVAHNGLNFDFPIIKTHLEKLKMSFSDDLLCADSFHGFYDIENESTADNICPKDKLDIVNEVQGSLLPNYDNIEQGFLTGTVDSENNVKNVSIINTTDIGNEREYSTSIDDTDFLIKDMKQTNETTPKRQKCVAAEPRRVMKARRRFPWSEQRPSVSYKLKDIFMREFSSPLEGLHSAEADCIGSLKIAMSKSDKFVLWVDKNCSLFSEVNPMRPGVRIGE